MVDGDDDGPKFIFTSTMHSSAVMSLLLLSRDRVDFQTTLNIIDPVNRFDQQNLIKMTLCKFQSLSLNTHCKFCFYILEIQIPCKEV